MMPTLLEVPIVYLPAHSLLCEIAEPIVTAKGSPIELRRLRTAHPNCSQMCCIRVSTLWNLGNLQNLLPLGTGAEKLSWMTQSHRESWQAQIVCTVRKQKWCGKECIHRGRRESSVAQRTENRASQSTAYEDGTLGIADCVNGGARK